MSKNLSPDEVCHRLVMFLATKGVALSKADQAEIRARVLGHQNMAAQARYEQNTGRFQVFELELDDIDADGSVQPKATFSRLPLDESTSLSLARVMAQQAAALRGRPCLLCDANFENAEVVDEPPNADPEALVVYQALGELRDANSDKLDGSLAEDFTFHTRHATVRGAVASGKRVMAGLLEEAPADETNHHLVLVANDVADVILWRSYC